MLARPADNILSSIDILDDAAEHFPRFIQIRRTQFQRAIPTRALLRAVAIGWKTSWASEAANSPMMLSRFTVRDLTRADEILRAPLPPTCARSIDEALFAGQPNGVLVKAHVRHVRNEVYEFHKLSLCCSHLFGLQGRIINISLLAASIEC